MMYAENEEFELGREEFIFFLLKFYFGTVIVVIVFIPSPAQDII